MSKTLDQLFSTTDSQLRSITAKAQLLRSLTQQLHTLIDEPLNNHLYIANLRGQSLVIGTDSAVWVTRARYLAPMILQHFKQCSGFEQLTTIEFKVQLFMPDKSTVSINKPHLSKTACASILSGAENIADPLLKHALKRLSKQNQ